ncbi:MAG: YlxM family DNA-binding protein [Lachnospiraceae bacterium]
MEKFLEQTLLYDFYGELLTEHQKRIYEQFSSEDLSLSEIAEDEGISRQGVHDLIKRCNKSLEEYENKLHLVSKFLSIKEKVHRMDVLLETHDSSNTDDLLSHIRRMADEIIEEL